MIEPPTLLSNFKGVILVKPMIIEKNVHNYTGFVTIRQGDWDYPLSLSDMASRIIADWSFDENCRKRSLNNNRFSKRDGEAL